MATVQTQRQKPRNSLSHPIKISWLFTETDQDLIVKTLSKHPIQMLSTVSASVSASAKKRKSTFMQLPIPSTIDFEIERYNPCKRLEMELSEACFELDGDPICQQLELELELEGSPPPFSFSEPHPKWSGNFALSSCPGKKVRLDCKDNPNQRKASVCRDVGLDLTRIAMSQISVIFCLLDDQELRLIGVEWLTYVYEAQRVGITIFRLPIVEGCAPPSVDSVNKLLDFLDTQQKQQKQNVLCHCRGGIGRAGVIAVCYMLRKRYFASVREAVAHLRARRSQKAIETKEQMNFLHIYLKSLSKVP